MNDNSKITKQIKTTVLQSRSLPTQLWDYARENFIKPEIGAGNLKNDID